MHPCLWIDAFDIGAKRRKVLPLQMEVMGEQFKLVSSMFTLGSLQSRMRMEPWFVETRGIRSSAQGNSSLSENIEVTERIKITRTITTSPDVVAVFFEVGAKRRKVLPEEIEVSGDRYVLASALFTIGSRLIAAVSNGHGSFIANRICVVPWAVFTRRWPIPWPFKNGRSCN